MGTQEYRRSSARRRGAALLYTMILALAMAGLCVALLGMNIGTGRERVHTRTQHQSFYAAEAGLSDAYMQLSAGLLAVTADTPAYVGSEDAPVALGTISYWVEVREVNSRAYSIAATGIDGRSQHRLELVLSEAPSGFFQYAAFGADGVTLDSNAFIDSYDSARGTYDSQVQGGNDYARENGHVGSNHDIELKSNTTVHGDVRPGPGGVLDDSAPRIFISGSTEPAEELVEFPPIEAPVIASSGSIDSGDAIVLGPGDIHYDSIMMTGGGKLIIRGPARLVVDEFTMKTNSELVFDSTNGEIDIYAMGDFVLESNSDVITNSDSALGVTLLLAGNNTTKRPADSVSLSANSDFIGAIYAPNAQFSLGSNFSIFGSIMCGYLDLSSFGEIHYDEALMYDGWGSSGEYEPALWQHLPLQ